MSLIKQALNAFRANQLKVLQTLHTKSLAEEAKTLKEVKAAPQNLKKQSSDLSGVDVDADHTKAQEAVDKLVAKQMEQKREQQKRDMQQREKRKQANKRKQEQAGPKELSPKVSTE